MSDAEGLTFMIREFTLPFYQAKGVTISTSSFLGQETKGIEFPRHNG